ncbi:MAG TPA: acyl carrier protein [Spirochaetota bacterium]|nr:acyl carrier protein [Spirochaetota bacterium]
MSFDYVKTSSEIKDIISKIARMDRENIRDDSRLRDELFIDSLLAIQIAALIEKKYQIKLDETEIFNVDNVKDIVDLVKEYSENKEK